jgi:hypothetical protein
MDGTKPRGWQYAAGHCCCLACLHGGRTASFLWLLFRFRAIMHRLVPNGRQGVLRRWTTCLPLVIHSVLLNELHQRGPIGVVGPPARDNRRSQQSSCLAGRCCCRHRLESWLIMYEKPVCMSTVGGAILRLIGVIRQNISPNGLLATDERGDRAIVTKWRKRRFCAVEV